MTGLALNSLGGLRTLRGTLHRTFQAKDTWWGDNCTSRPGGCRSLAGAVLCRICETRGALHRAQRHVDRGNKSVLSWTSPIDLTIYSVQPDYSDKGLSQTGKSASLGFCRCSSLASQLLWEAAARSGQILMGRQGAPYPAVLWASLRIVQDIRAAGQPP